MRNRVPVWIGALRGSYTSFIANWRPELGTARVAVGALVIPALAVVAGTRAPSVSADGSTPAKDDTKPPAEASAARQAEPPVAPSLAPTVHQSATERDEDAA